MHERRMAGRTGRAVARPVRVARTHAPRVLLAAVALIVVLSQSSLAYALPWQEKDGYPLGEIGMHERLGNMRGTFVYGAANEFFATLCLIGRKSDYLQLSSEQLSELSGEGTGGAFYELSQRWRNFETDGRPSPVDYSTGFLLNIDGQSLVSDPKYIWYCDYTYYDADSLYQRALDDYMTIYNGGHLGGGGGLEQFDGWYKVQLPAALEPYSNPNKTVSLIANATFSVDSNGIGKVTGGSVSGSYRWADGPIYLLIDPYSYNLITSNSKNNFCWIRSWTSTYVLCFDGSFSWKKLNNDSNYGILNSSSSVLHYDEYTSKNNNLYKVGDDVCALFINANKYLTDMQVTPNGSSQNFKPFWNTVIGPDGGGGGGGGGTWPEPDPPTPPNPPEVPGPGTNDDPGIELPDPYMPIVDPVTDPDPITDPYVVVAAPDSTDIIEWLRAILRAINNLGDKLNAESTELQNALNKVFFTNLSRLLKNLKGEFIQDYTSWLNKELQWLNSEIHDYFVDLQNYLYRLFDWLADQMNFELNLNTDPYDDTSLLNWLRRIYNQLGAVGGPNTRPVDPSTDEDGFLDWLRRMIQNFILDLGAAASDVVSDLGDLLSRLFAKFPFSVPWDLLAILGILDAPTMVPRLTFDIPLTMGTSAITWHVDVDLEPWSVYLEAVRTILLVSFISWLIWLTPQVLRDLDPGDFL